MDSEVKPIRFRVGTLLFLTTVVAIVVGSLFAIDRSIDDFYSGPGNSPWYNDPESTKKYLDKHAEDGAHRLEVKLVMIAGTSVGVYLLSRGLRKCVAPRDT